MTIDATYILARLAEITTQRAEADLLYSEQQTQLVGLLRSQQQPWSDIAEALGTSKQAAHERYRDITAKAEPTENLHPRTDVARDTYPWLFKEPDAHEVARLVAEEAHRALTATTLPAGYGPAPDGGHD